MKDDRQPDIDVKENIVLKEDYEVRYWCKVFKVTQEELVTAVEAVGANTKDIARYFTRKKG